MDRKQIVYPAQIPLETDILNTKRNVLISIGRLLGDLIGTSTLASGLPLHGHVTRVSECTNRKWYSI